MSNGKHYFLYCECCGRRKRMEGYVPVGYDPYVCAICIAEHEGRKVKK